MAKRKTLTNQELCDFLDNLSEIEDEFDDDEVELFGNSITKRVGADSDDGESDVVEDDSGEPLGQNNSISSRIFSPHSTRKDGESETLFGLDEDDVPLSILFSVRVLRSSGAAKTSSGTHEEMDESHEEYNITDKNSIKWRRARNNDRIFNPAFERSEDSIEEVRTPFQ